MCVFFFKGKNRKKPYTIVQNVENKQRLKLLLFYLNTLDSFWSRDWPRMYAVIGHSTWWKMDIMMPNSNMYPNTSFADSILANELSLPSPWSIMCPRLENVTENPMWRPLDVLIGNHGFCFTYFFISKSGFSFSNLMFFLFFFYSKIHKI